MSYTTMPKAASKWEGSTEHLTQLKQSIEKKHPLGSLLTRGALRIGGGIGLSKTAGKVATGKSLDLIDNARVLNRVESLVNAEVGARVSPRGLFSERTAAMAGRITELGSFTNWADAQLGQPYGTTMSKLQTGLIQSGHVIDYELAKKRKAILNNICNALGITTAVQKVETGVGALDDEVQPEEETPPIEVQQPVVKKTEKKKERSNGRSRGRYDSWGGGVNMTDAREERQL